MEIKNATTERLKIEIDKCKRNIECYTKAQNYLPVSSVLGRMSIEWSIKYENKRMDKLLKELSTRDTKENLHNTEDSLHDIKKSPPRKKLTNILSTKTAE